MKNQYGTHWRKSEDRLCEVDGCSKIHFGKGFCLSHYRKWKRWEDPEFKYEHGKSHERIYSIWMNMKRRCGIRGKYKSIKVCERWKDFRLFYADIGDPPQNNSQLHRVWTEKGYKPNNVIWVTPPQHREIHAKLSPQVVKKIRREYESGKTSTRQLAAKHGISKSYVYAITSKRLRKEV